ncbi:MAG: hypothetical protein ACREJC_22405 [Tepidisphaeraceae bacterium]
MLTGAKLNPLDISGRAYKNRVAPFDCMCEVIHRATLVSMTVQITVGNEEVQATSPVSAGGTTGVFTGRLNVEPVTFRAAKGEEIQINYANGNAGTVNVDGSLEMVPIK